MAEDPAVAAADAERPPGGCMLHFDGGDTVLYASSRSPVAAAGLLGFAVFWNGVVSTFVGSALRGTMEHLTGSAPAWLDKMPMSSSQSGWELVGLWLFLLPFVAIGVGTIGAVVMALVGHIEVRLGRDEGSVFTGIGPLGWRRRFTPAAADLVKLDHGRWSNEGGRPRVIALHADRTIRFGSVLPKKRRGWMVAALRRALLAR